MKRELCFFIGFLAAMPAFAVDKNKPIDLTGHWKEISRMSTAGSRLDYVDTTYYDFLIGNEYTTQRKNSFMYRGTYKAAGNKLDLGMRSFEIRERSRDRLLLKDDAGIYEFVRYDKAAAMAENSSAATSSKRAHKPEPATGRVDAAQLPGKWEVYKRTSNKTLSRLDYNRIIRVIDLQREAGELRGSVSSAKDMDGKPSWTIVRYDDGILYCSGKDDRRLEVLRCQDGELIVREGAITYFFKQFK